MPGSARCPLNVSLTVYILLYLSHWPLSLCLSLCLSHFASNFQDLKTAVGWQVIALQVAGGVRIVSRAWVDECLDDPTTPLTDDAFAVPPRASDAVQRVCRPRLRPIRTDGLRSRRSLPVRALAPVSLHVRSTQSPLR